MHNEEDLIQADCYEWFHNRYCLRTHKPRFKVFSVPNGGKRSKLQAIKLKATGVKKGASDLIIAITGRVLFIEVKTQSGTQSKEQVEFEADIKALGLDYYLVRSLDEFKALMITIIGF